MGTKQQAETTDEGARSFCRMLEQLDDGQGSIHMSVELRDLMGQLRQHAVRTDRDAKGMLTLKLAFNVEPNGIVNVAYETATKTPKKKTGKTTLWLTRGDNLAAQNPRQQNLPLAEVKDRQHYTELSDNDNAGRGAIKDV